MYLEIAFFDGTIGGYLYMGCHVYTVFFFQFNSFIFYK